MKTQKILKSILFGLAIFVSISIFGSLGFEKKQFEQEAVRDILDILLITSLILGLYFDWKNKRNLMYWTSALVFGVILSIDTIVWFKSSIAEQWPYALHIGIMSGPLFIYLYYLFKRIRNSAYILISLGVILFISGVFYHQNLNELYQSTLPNFTFEELISVRLITYYSYYLSILSFITGVIILIDKKCAKLS